jgi:thiol-disulfide isomerase/thioredoxin
MPDTRVYQAEGAAPADSPSSDREETSLAGDFEIVLYQGEDALGGSTVAFSDVFDQGKPVVLSIWAGLCPICRVEMPDLQKAYEQYHDELLVIGVDVGPFVGLGNAEDGMALLDELGITYPAGATPDQSIMRDYKILGTPATIFLKPDGEVIDRWNGLLTANQLDAKIEALLEASGTR